MIYDFLVSSNKIPVVVFDNADLDSACTSIIDSAWGYQGLVRIKYQIYDCFCTIV